MNIVYYIMAQSNKTKQDIKNKDCSGNVEGFPRFWVIEAKDKNTQLSSLSLFVIEKVLQGSVGSIASCRKLREGGLLVEVSKKAHCDSLRKMSTFFNIEITASAHRTLNSCRGVVQCMDLAGLSEQEIADNMKGVSHVRHITKFSNGVKVPSGSLIVTFDTTVLPQSIKAGYLNLKVRPYIPNPLRCFKCQSYGHHSSRCTREEICPKCSEKVHTGECIKDLKCKYYTL